MARTLSVSQLNAYIKGMFGDEILLHNIEVYGEISEFSSSNNNTYITVRDDSCVMHCVKFGLFEALPIGMKVKLSGAVTFYEKGGKVVFNIKDINPYGEGEYFLRLQKLKAKLKDEGFFEKALPLPFVVKRMAVITGSAGIVIHDILSVIKNRAPVDICVYPVKIQGEGADTEIINALNAAADSGRFDCIMIARGGGANTDLETFNSEKLARAAASCKVPVISAVGHESDYTLCDLCAGTRAGTPSIAARIIVDKFESALSAVKETAVRLNFKTAQIYKSHEAALIREENKISLISERRLANYNNKLLKAASDLGRAAEKKIDSSKAGVLAAAKKIDLGTERFFSVKEENFKRAAASLEWASPLALMSKGYVKAVKDGAAVNSVSGIEKGDNINIVFFDGIAAAKIEYKREVKT